jgi:hypothetical protein
MPVAGCRRKGPFAGYFVQIGVRHPLLRVFFLWFMTNPSRHSSLGGWELAHRSGKMVPREERVRVATTTCLSPLCPSI